jgi:hypothetical protein
MTHRELLSFIQLELEKNGFHWRSRKEFFEKLLPDEEYAFYRSNLSNWFGGKPGKITNRDFLVALQERIGFEGSVWGADDRTQREVIRQAVKRFMRPTPKVDLSALLPQNTPLSDPQAALLLEVKKASATKALTLLDAHTEYLLPHPDNQNFLLKLLTTLFDKGLYDMLNEAIFPALLPHNANHNHIKVFQAHTLGSLSSPDYLRAASMLMGIKTDTPDELLELKTGVISNVRRYNIEKESLSKKELSEVLPVLIQYYTDVFEHVEQHHYYPGVNLCYMLKLSQLTSPQNPHIDTDDLEKIFQDAQASLSRGAHSPSDETRYYARISEAEFRLLLGRNHLAEHLVSWLDNQHPSPPYVARTLRMMQFFVRTVERFGVGDCSDVLGRFAEVMEILEGYVEHTPAV